MLIYVVYMILDLPFLWISSRWLGSPIQWLGCGKHVGICTFAHVVIHSCGNIPLC